jgi:hypothetical protein
VSESLTTQINQVLKVKKSQGMVMSPAHAILGY